MLNYSKVFNLDKEKDANKVYQALDNGYGREYLENFMSEAKSQSTQDIPKAKATITSSYVCSYEGFKKSLFIIPLADIVNVYMSNSFYGNYSYDTKAIAIETRDNKTFYYARRMKNQKVPDADRLFEMLKKVSASNEATLTA
ncbi:MAG: hypothetical protein J6Z06_04185 [Lachnospiraceae bacterium]|nr:hypothetical protein [Lachnospiraceae bacterium]